MTVTTTNGRRPAITERHVPADVHVRVRSPENGPPGGSGPDPARGSVRARAIPGRWVKRQLSDATEFISLNVTDLVSEGACGWGATEQPQPLAVTWRQVVPAPGEASGRLSWLALAADGLFRALVHSAAYLFIFSTATRMRARVMGLITAVLLTTYLVAGCVAG